MKNRKQHIYEEAAILFREKGYMATSMRELAVRVGLEPSSLYSHIKSKEEILRKICFDNARRFIVGIEEIDQNFLTPTQKIEAIINLHIEVAIEDCTSTTVFNDEWRHLSEPKLSEFLKLRRLYEEKFKRIITEGIAKGQFKNLKPSTVMYTLLSSVRWIHYWHRPGKDPRMPELKKEITLMLMSGLKVSH
ncbi:MAG: TetR/AcrR family transcriptional regulator [Bacteroidota bacterium]